VNGNPGLGMLLARELFCSDEQHDYPVSSFSMHF
jgi:hypothetical protein